MATPLHRLFRSKYSIAAMINELQKMCLGTLFVDEAGKIKFVLYDASGTVQRTLTEADIFDLKVDTTYGLLCNQIRFQMASDSAIYQGGWTRKDTASQTNFTPPSGSAYVSERTVDFPLLKSRYLPSSFITTTSATDITIKDGDVISLCGTRGADNPGSQPADAKISTSRPLYLRIEEEIIKETSALTISTSGNQVIPLVVDENGKISGTGGTKYYATVTLPSGGMTRAALSSTAAEHPDESNTYQGTSVDWRTYVEEEPIQDLTIPEYWARKQLPRFSNGCPIMSFKTSLRHADLQISDMIYIDHPLYAFYQDVEADSSTIWEIINKEVNVMEGKISWKVARVTRSSITSTTDAYGFWGAPSGSTAASSIIRNAGTSRTGQNSIQGMNLAVGSGLTFTIDKGTANVGLKSYRFAVKMTHTVAASKDTYVYVDSTSGSIVLNAVANGADQPDSDENLIIVGKVVSGASSVSSVVYMANTKPATSALVGMNDRISDNLISNGNFGSWSAGALTPPDGWFYIQPADPLSSTGTDPRTVAPASWGTEMYRTRSASYAGEYAVACVSSATYNNLNYFMQTELIPVPYGASLTMVAKCVSYTKNDYYTHVYVVVAEYNEKKEFLEVYEIDAQSQSTSPYFSSGVTFGSIFEEIELVNTAARYARLGLLFTNGLYDGSGSNSSTFIVDNVEAYVPTPNIQAYRTTNQTGIVTATWTDLVSNSATAYEYQSRWLDFWTYSTGTFRTPLAGSYTVSACVKFLSVANGTKLEMRLTDETGTELKRMGEIYNNTGGTADIVLKGWAVYAAPQNKQLKIQVKHDHGSNRDISGTQTECWMSFVFDSNKSAGV